MDVRGVTTKVPAIPINSVAKDVTVFFHQAFEIDHKPSAAMRYGPEGMAVVKVNPSLVHNATSTTIQKTPDYLVNSLFDLLTFKEKLIKQGDTTAATTINDGKAVITGLTLSDEPFKVEVSYVPSRSRSWTS